jgi:hypothetical protein
MNEGLEASADQSSAQRAIDKQHLNLLSIFHFVGAGLAFLGVGFVLVHYALMSTLTNNAALWAKNQAGPPPAEFFAMFKWFYLMFGGWFGTTLLFNMLAGFYLRARKHRTVCFITAALNCLHIPFGTVLGIFTIIVLVRDSVRRSFEQRSYGVSVE